MLDDDVSRYLPQVYFATQLVEASSGLHWYILMIHPSGFKKLISAKAGLESTCKTATEYSLQ